MIPGVFSRFPNDQVASLKASPWPQLLALLGRSGEKIMINMLVDCSIFVAIQSGPNNFYQISGIGVDAVSEASANAMTRKPNIGARLRPTKESRWQTAIVYAKDI